MSYMHGLRVVISRTEVSAQGATLVPGLDMFKRRVEPARIELAIAANVVALPEERFDVVTDHERLVGTVLVPETKEQIDKRLGNPPSERAITDALDVLRRAGWTVRQDTSRGVLVDAGEYGPLLAYGLGFDPAAKSYRRWMARQDWEEIDADRPPVG